MQKAVPVGVGAMAALIGLEYGDAKVIAAEAAGAGVCAAANDNGGEQVVLSGDKAAVERAVEISQDARCEAGHAATGLRTLPLRPDATGRGRDGRGPRRSRR